MFAPAILAGMSEIGTIASAAIGAGSAIMSGISQHNMAGYQAAVAQRNATIALNNANQAEQQGVLNAQRNDMKSRALIGNQLATQGASGLDVGSGSPLAVRESSAEIGRYDSLNIMHQADMQAYNFKNEAATDQASAKLYEAGGKNSLLSGFIGAGSSLLGGASSFADKWNMYKLNGVTPDLSLGY